MISIVLPTYDRGAAFGRALTSALTQTYPVHEIIVSDDGGAPETAHYVAEARSQFPRALIRHHVWTRHVDMVTNWMLGAAMAEGSWIKYLFDDDWLEPDCLEVMAGLTRAETTVVSCGGWFEPGSVPCYDRYNTSWPIHEAVRQGVLSVSPVTTLIHRRALISSFAQFPMLPRECIDTGVGPNVLMNYGQVVGRSQYRHAYTPAKLVHLGGDDLPGERRSLTSRLKAEAPDTLYGNHAKAYDLLDELAGSAT